MIWGVITWNSDKNEGVSFRLDTPLHQFGFFYLFERFWLHISDDFVESFFVAIYGVFETRRERAAVTLFLSVLLERNTLPLTGAWGGWVVGGLGGGWLAGGWLAGCWLLGMDHWFRYIYIYVFQLFQTSSPRNAELKIAGKCSHICISFPPIPNQLPTKCRVKNCLKMFTDL